MKIDELERELRAVRPQVDPDYGRRLDEWAAAGFPRGGALDPGRARDGAADRSETGPFRRLRERIASAPPRRVLAPAGAVAALIVVGGVAISQRSDFTGGADLDAPALEDTGGRPAGGAGESAGGRGVAAEPAAPAPESAGDAALDKDARRAEDFRGSADDEALRSIGPADTVVPIPPPPGTGGGLAPGVDKRLRDATARLSLGAEADEVQDVANGVVEVVDRNDGIVVDSQVTTDQGGARASFELEIPFERLGRTLTELSELGDVISRTEGARDITGQAVRARKRLANTYEQIRELRIELIKADTRERRLVLRAQINSLQASADAIDAELDGVKRQARFATVAVDITSTDGSSDGEWSLDDAVDDAVDVLRTIGGIALVSLAILLPLALVLALAYWAFSTARRRSRERTLDQA